MMNYPTRRAGKPGAAARARAQIAELANRSARVEGRTVLIASRIDVCVGAFGGFIVIHAGQVVVIGLFRGAHYLTS